MNDYEKQKYSCSESPTILEPGKQAREKYDPRHLGYDYYALTTDMLYALIKGKQIALDSQGEYTVFICLEDVYTGN
jgi:hypothetical protein